MALALTSIVSTSAMAADSTTKHVKIHYYGQINDDAFNNKIACSLFVGDGVTLETDALNVQTLRLIPVMEKHNPGTFDQSKYDAAVAQFTTDVNAFTLKSNAKVCKNSKQVNVSNAYATESMTRIQHLTNEEWEVNKNLSVQQFEKCIVDFYGTEQSARCQTQQESFIKEALKWSQFTKDENYWFGFRQNP